LKFRIVRGCRQQHANASHPLGLLRPRRERPRGRTAKQRDEFAALHVAPLPWQLAQQLVRNAYDVVFTVMNAR
jgi:hypothetical protein